MGIARSRQVQAVAAGTIALLAGLIGLVISQPVLTVVGLGGFGAVVLVLLAHVHQRTGTTMWTAARIDRATVRHGAALTTLTDRAEVDDDRLHLEKALAHQTTALRTRWDARLDDLADQIAGQLRDLDGRVDDPAGVARRIRAVHDRIDRAHARTVTELDALAQLHRHVPDDAAVTPLLSRWALAPSAALDLVDHILTHRPGLVVECGAGASTLHLARALQRTGGRLVSLEHLDDHAAEVRRRLDTAGLADVVEVRSAPLIDSGHPHGDGRWYAPETWKDLYDIDLLVVDGPPGGDDRNARGVALPALIDRLRPGAHILLDDVERPQERDTLRTWQADHPLRRLPALATGHALLLLDHGRSA